MPLQEVLQALSRTPVSQAQVRSVLAFTAARWNLQAGRETEATRLLGQALEAVPDLRPAMRMLYRFYAGKRDVRTAVMYLDQEIRATRHPREAAALYRERGQLVEEHFRDLGAALQCYDAALKATPADLAVLRSVERVSLGRGDVFHLIANLEAQLEILQDPGAVTGVLRDLALLETRHGGDFELGADLVLAALEAFPHHLGLIGDLFRLAEAAGDAPLMLQALELEAEAKPAHKRAMALARASLLLREHRERAAAVTLLRAAALAQPDNLSLWRNLEELSMASSRYETALEACLGQLRAIGDAEPWARAELYYRVGRLAMMRLDRVAEGLAAMRRAMRLFPGHVPALEDAARYLIGREAWAQLFELLKLQITTAREAGLTAAEIAQAHLRTGQLLEERLGELEGARRAYADAMAAAPSYRPPRDRLERVLHQLADQEGLKHFYRDELARCSNAPRRVFLLSVLGQLHAGDPDPEVAMGYLVALLKELPEHMASLQRLARLLARAGRTKDLLRVTEQEVKLTLSPARKAKLLHRAGELALSLEDLAHAERCFERALDAIDDHKPSIAALERLVRIRGNDQALLELLRKRLLYANDRGRQLALRLEIATLLSTRLGRDEDALRELEALLERAPRHLPALHAAERLAARLEHWPKVLALLDQHIGAVQGPRTRALLLHRAANVRSTRLDDHEGAIRELVRALDLWPQLGVARALLLRLYEQLGRSRELQAFAEAGLTSERGADDRRAMALQLAELTPRAVVAIQYLGAVAEARPDDFVTQLRLGRAARAARRPSREAGALASAAGELARRGDTTDPTLLAMLFQAARAEEAAGNLDSADEGYARILDVEPGHLLARRGRMRVKARKQQAATATRSEDLGQAERKARHAAEQAAYATIAAELHERRGDLARALARAEEAVGHCADYLPALHARAGLLERVGGAENVEEAIRTLERLAELERGETHRVRILCRAGTIALRTADPNQHNERAWVLFGRAIELAPDSDVAFRGLVKTNTTHGAHGAPSLESALGRRLAALRERGELTVSQVREMARLVADSDGVEAATKLLEAGVPLNPTDPGLRAELAQVYARLGRWADVVRELETALERELSPERAAALHYFTGDALERAGQSSRAIDHYLAAGRGGFHPLWALLSADRIAAETGALPQRVEALQALIDIGDGQQRVRSLRALADLHRGPLGEPDVAVELLQELLLLQPTDLDVLCELQRLLTKLERPDEANATLLAGIAHHRAWLRAQGVHGERKDQDVAPVRGLLRLFDLLGEADGVYLATAILEVAAPPAAAGLRGCDAIVREPWPLPRAQDGRPFDHLVGDLPGSAALDLLHEGVFFLPGIPGAPPGPASPGESLPSSSGVVMVVRALADAMGIPQPLVFLDTADEMGVRAQLGKAPALHVGRRINSAPFAPEARDALGRGLMRLAAGGDHVRRSASDAQLTALLVGLCRAAGFSPTSLPDHDPHFAADVQASLPDAEDLGLAESARAFVEALPHFDAAVLRQSMAMAEDRAGIVAAADPRPGLRGLLEARALVSTRGTSLVGYVLSDDHLSLRRALGYHVDVELDLADVEEIPE
jgi:tetratricopeptide (TPR) repeat protein